MCKTPKLCMLKIVFLSRIRVVREEKMSCKSGIFNCAPAPCVWLWLRDVRSLLVSSVQSLFWKKKIFTTFWRSFQVTAFWKINLHDNESHAKTMPHIWRHWPSWAQFDPWLALISNDLKDTATSFWSKVNRNGKPEDLRYLFTPSDLD